MEDKASGVVHEVETIPEPTKPPPTLDIQLGTPVMPYARFNAHWQYVDSDTEAIDYLLESGYKTLAFSARNTCYGGSTPDRLQTSQFYGMLRAGASENEEKNEWEIAFGLGSYRLDGDLTSECGIAATLPIKFYPLQQFGVEFRPAWTDYNSHMLGDYDLSANIGYRILYLQLGYRWLRVGNTTWLEGPHAGFSLSF